MASLRFFLPFNCSFLVLVGAAACSGGNGGISLQSLAERFEDTLCEAQVECNLYPDVQTCRENSHFDEGSGIAQLEASVTAGRANYNSDEASACLDGYAGLLDGCEIFGGEDYDLIEESCEAVFTGNVELGGDCYIDEECAGDAQCERDCQEECCTGVCVDREPDPAPVDIGEDCSEADCVAGAWCKYDSVAQTQTCTAEANEGEACEGSSMGSCADGLICDGYPDGICKRPAEQGETCDPLLGYGYYSCIRIDNWCDPSDTTCKLRPGPGEACMQGQQGDNCLDYAYCGPDETCVQRPGVGEACGGTAEITCLGDLDCVGELCTEPDPDPVCE